MELIYFTKFLQGLSAEEVGRTAKRLGFDGLDLAIRRGQCVNPDNVESALPEAMKIWKDQGLSVPLVSMETRPTDPRAQTTVRIYEACGKAGIPRIKVGYWHWKEGAPYWPGVEAIRKDMAEFEKLGRKTGIKTVIHTHSGYYYGGNASSAMLLVRGFDPKFVGIYLDPGHLAVSGEPLALALGIARDYLAMISAKNCFYVRPKSGHWKLLWGQLEEGLVDWRRALGLFKKFDYTGPLSVHGEYSNTKGREDILARVAKDMRYLRGLLG